jgi:hypothetical protein
VHVNKVKIRKGAKEITAKAAKTKLVNKKYLEKTQIFNL